MNDFKVGDRVEYVGNVSSVMLGKVGVVVEPPFANSGMVYFDHGGAESYGAYSQSLRHVTTAPDVITINRADLPDVCTQPSGLLTVDDSNYHDRCTAAEWRESANRRIALAEFVEAREKAAKEAAAEKEAKEKLGKRRDELAVEFGASPLGYADTFTSTQRAIDRIIELETDRG